MASEANENQGGTVADYVILMKLTAKGTQHLADAGTWVPLWKTAWESLGGTWQDPQFTLGEYDVVLGGAMDDEDKVAAFVVWLTNDGRVSTTTMRAYSPSEFLELLPDHNRGYAH
jgi:uncharacterized protein with GYD domain